MHPIFIIIIDFYNYTQINHSKINLENINFFIKLQKYQATG